MSAPPIGMISSTQYKGQGEHDGEGQVTAGEHESQAKQKRAKAHDQIQLVLAGKLYWRTLEQAKLVSARQLAKGNDRA
jgi:hypothetical protein